MFLGVYDTTPQQRELYEKCTNIYKMSFGKVPLLDNPVAHDLSELGSALKYTPSRNIVSPVNNLIADGKDL